MPKSNNNMPFFGGIHSYIVLPLLLLVCRKPFKKSRDFVALSDYIRPQNIFFDFSLLPVHSDQNRNFVVSY